MTANLKGKVAIVTGSTTGIGRGIAHTLAGRGCSLVLTGIGSEEGIQVLIQEFKSKYNGNFHFVPGNFLVTEEIEKFCKSVLALYPAGVDILVNNAGVPGRGPIETVPNDIWFEALAVNLTAPFLLVKTFFPLMKQKGWGRIINIASLLGVIGEPNKIAYCTTKSGLLGLSRVIAIEGAKHGITCNPICPGLVDAPMGISNFAHVAVEKGISFEQCKTEFLEQKTITGRAIPISQVAEMVAFLVSDAAENISGSPILIDGASFASNR